MSEVAKHLDGILATLESMHDMLHVEDREALWAGVHDREIDLHFEILDQVHQELLERVRYVRELNCV